MQKQAQNLSQTEKNKKNQFVLPGKADRNQADVKSRPVLHLKITRLQQRLFEILFRSRTDQRFSCTGARTLVPAG